MDGALITDLTVEEASEYRRAMAAHNLDTVFLAAPTSPDQRLKAIAEACKGFVYAVSRTGITGTQKQVAADVQGLVKRIRKFTKLPVAVGFGISNAQQFAEVGQFADGVVVGSAIVQTDRTESGQGSTGSRELCARIEVRNQERGLFTKLTSLSYSRCRII